MTRTTIVLALAGLLAGASFGVAEDTAPAGDAAKISHPFICAGSGTKDVSIVGADGKVQWTYPVVGACNDVWRLANGNIVFADKGGAKEVTPEGRGIGQ